MPTYKRSAVTAKEGINFVRTAIECGGSLFLKIEQENDLGIDALIEFVRDERPLNKQVAVQIKSGASYYTADARECAFPIGAHRSYWSAHPLPVFAIIYVPAQKAAYWLNLKKYLKANPEATTVRFPATEVNLFNAKTFKSLFMPAMLGEVPLLSFDDASRLASSNRPSETYLGLLVLFRRFPNECAVWNRLISLVRSLPVEEIAPIWVYWLAHIPGHGDIFYHGQAPSPEIRAYVNGEFSDFDLPEVVKLLQMINSEDQIGRGTLGQSVEAILSSLPGIATQLRKVITSSELEMNVRESAALILAMNEGAKAIPDLLKLVRAGSWYAGEIARYVKEHGGINPYA